MISPYQSGRIDENREWARALEDILPNGIKITPSLVREYLQHNPPTPNPSSPQDQQQLLTVTTKREDLDRMFGEGQWVVCVDCPSAPPDQTAAWHHKNYHGKELGRRIDLLGEEVVVTLSSDKKPKSVAYGTLLSFGDSGEIVLKDDEGFLHYCWPLLEIRRADAQEG